MTARGRRERKSDLATKGAKGAKGGAKVFGRRGKRGFWTGLTGLTGLCLGIWREGAAPSAPYWGGSFCLAPSSQSPRRKTLIKFSFKKFFYIDSPKSTC